MSLAGRRRGLKDGTRSGLWSEFARAIDTIRPEWVVIENVRGLLSADAAVDVEPCPLCVGDNPGHVLRALGAVLGDLAELGFDAEWVGLRAADVGAPHGRFRVFILAWPATHTDRAGLGRERRIDAVRRDADGRGRADGTGNGTEPEASLTLLPTPVAQPSGNTPEDHLRKKPGRTVVTDLAIMAENDLIAGGGRLLPTPQVADGTGGHASRSGDRSGEFFLPGIARLLPTPRTTDMNGPGAHGAGGADLRTTVSMMPTPRATRGGSSTEMSYAMGGERSDAERPQGVVVPGTDWGPYTAAVRRWEAILGHPAPSPVRMDGKGGKARLNPALPEWMMGWPEGWVTDPAIGLTRAEQLKACGNGVVPQQAAHALRTLLARPGVPALEAVPA